MSSTYAGNAANYPENLTLPTDGDPNAASTYRPGFDGLADRTAFLKAGIAVVTDLNALAAIASPADGLVRHVLGQGLFVFKSSATTGLSPFRVAAADATPGGWVASAAHETSLTRYVPCRAIIGVTPSALLPTAANVLFNVLTASDLKFVAGGGVTILRSSTHATNAWGFLLPLDEHLVDGATLASATLRWVPGGAGGPPAVLPRMAIVRSDRNGEGSPSAGTTYASLHSSDFVFDAAGTYTIGAARDLVFTPDQNNVIDRSSYSYCALIYDECGTGATDSNTFHALALAMSGVPDGRR